jgi:cytochrome c biogenesis protein CcmG/thiol:disulfide interchange protein DsbE
VRSWGKFLLLAVTAVVVTQLLVQRSEPPFEAGQVAPPLALPALDGRVVELTALKGRVVAVNFWATWCAPCVAELPELAAAWESLRPSGCFELLGVAEESARDDVAAMAARLPYPVLVDARAAAASAWKVPGYPRTYLVDAEGRVRRVHDGPMRRADLEAEARALAPASCPAP